MPTQLDPFDEQPELPRIVAISLQRTGHLHSFLSAGLPLKRGDRVVVESDIGTRIGTVEIEPHEPALTLDLTQLKPVIRLAEEHDSRVEEDMLSREAHAERLCAERIRQRELPMKLVTVDYTLEGRKAVFYFSADNRIDFRELVRDLAQALRIRVEMKQIGHRDETKVVGAIGPCGRELCCSSWLRDFDSVTVKMAREQGLALNPSRLAGMCGRLKCCLRYEYATYLELKRALPNAGQHVESVKGNGKVLRQNILKQTVLIQLEEDGGVVEAALADLVDSRQNRREESGRRLDGPDE